MNNRITMKQLDSLCDQVNKIAGTPLTYCDKRGETPFKANIGHYHIHAAYSGVQMCQVSNESGGIHAITGYMTKRELFHVIRAFINGMQSKK